MLPPSVEEAIEDIEADHTSGANRIASMGLKALEALVKDVGPRLDPHLVQEAARRVAAGQRTNAALHNVTQLFAQLFAEGQDPRAILDQLRTELESAREAVARSFLKIAPDHATVVTLTFSANVLVCLQRAQAAGRIDRVYVMESRPVLEGRFLVIALTEAGVKATLVPDAMGPGLMAQSDYALVGADTVLRDGSFVNKTGTYALGLAAADCQKPLYVAAETLKFDARNDAASWPGAPEMSPREVWDRPPEKIDVMNRYFEVTPARLVTMYATERGAYAPDLVRTMLAQAKGQK
ncbi:MAG TPA: hypothetical protein VI999_03880 [Thermoplasmata archaeon]|nr:hypothetical protein [Thermoplasmata archaeon]